MIVTLFLLKTHQLASYKTLVVQEEKIRIVGTILCPTMNCCRNPVRIHFIQPKYITKFNNVNLVSIIKHHILY